jgi:anhydro-N-acetylmuramic acid kinase
MRVLGIMSGSSLDGLDMALCDFNEKDGVVGYDVIACGSAAFPDELHDRLLHISSSTAFDFAETHVRLGRFIGEQAKAFLETHGPSDLIASHGHTAFHQPKNGFTAQIGCGARISAITGVPAIVDFRSKDVALGGQGAPLVPIGERDLFTGFDAYINLGGIANISVHQGGKVTGTDLCFCNQPLNHLAGLAGLAYDADGKLARAGKVDEGLLARMMHLPFLTSAPVFTLGREHFEQDLLPLLHNEGLSIPDRLATSVEHTVSLLAKYMEANKVQRCLVTGGGAFNGFMLERLRASSSVELVVPDERTVAFKEAIIFAYLGWLRWHGKPNALASVTGSSRDNIGGAVYLPG